MEKIVQNEAELAPLVGEIAKKLKAGDIIALSGPLGSGKTTLTQHLLKSFGYAGPVNSPTFVIEHRYPVQYGDIETVLHLDLYRLNKQDLKQFDWEEYLSPDHQLTIIEWPEIAENYLPPHTKTITIEILNAKSRRLTLPNALT